MSSHDRYIDPDDMFADTRMTFGEHIEDLRRHLIRAILGFCVALVVAFFIGKPVLRFIARPVERQLSEYWARYNQDKQNEILQEVKDRAELQNVGPIPTKLSVRRSDLRRFMVEEFPLLKGKANEPALDIMDGVQDLLRALEVDHVVDWSKVNERAHVELSGEIADPLKWAMNIQRYYQLIKPPGLTTLSVQEAFVVYFKVCIMTGFVLGSPWIFYQIWAFIAAGLYPHEKKYVNVFLPFSLGLFLGGVFLCEMFVMDKAVEALLWFNQWLGLAPDLRLNEWLGFAIFMPLVFGISFQTPLVMLFLQRVGIFTVDAFRGKRRISWFLMAVFAAVITPSTDPFSMMFLWLPMGLLYEVGIALCVFLPGRPFIEIDTPESEDLVEV
jgi:sec-independent protein translocase protein TatC